MDIYIIIKFNCFKISNAINLFPKTGHTNEVSI